MSGAYTDKWKLSDEFFKKRQFLNFGLVNNQKINHISQIFKILFQKLIISLILIF